MSAAPGTIWRPSDQVPLRLLLLGVPGSLPGRRARSGGPVPGSLPSPVKFLLALAIGLAWSLLTYEACVRRTWIGRWLRGGAPRVPSAPRPVYLDRDEVPRRTMAEGLIRKPFSDRLWVDDLASDRAKRRGHSSSTPAEREASGPPSRSASSPRPRPRAGRIVSFWQACKK